MGIVCRLLVLHQIFVELQVSHVQLSSQSTATDSVGSLGLTLKGTSSTWNGYANFDAA